MRGNGPYLLAALHDVTNAQVLGHYRLRSTFLDGLVGDVDLSRLSHGKVFESSRDPEYLAQERVEPEIGTITWPSGADLSPS